MSATGQAKPGNTGSQVSVSPNAVTLHRAIIVMGVHFLRCGVHYQHQPGAGVQPHLRFGVYLRQSVVG